MYYLIYKITNQINGKSYIGKHQTKNIDDGYMGSGKLLKRAIEKYGIENFTKDIIEIYDTEQKMNLAEKILVVTDNEISYNLCSGGNGGFGFINKLGLCLTEKHKIAAKENSKFGINKIKQLMLNDDWKNIWKHKIKIANILSINNKGANNSFYSKKHSLETKEKIKKTRQDKHIGYGEKNSQYGTCWITNGNHNKKIKNNDIDVWIKQGYYKGRI